MKQINLIIFIYLIIYSEEKKQKSLEHFDEFIRMFEESKHN
jgi:hypothetical protein